LLNTGEDDRSYLFQMELGTRRYAIDGWLLWNSR
ncbi:hypothetical protein PSYMP_29519, partial [Pseudomonas amygdali pv. morsprunorum str. M302280]